MYFSFTIVSFLVSCLVNCNSTLIYTQLHSGINVRYLSLSCYNYAIASPISCVFYEGSSSSNNKWILVSCQAHRDTSRQSISGHKQIHISKLFSHIYINPLSSQSTKLRKHKTYIHKHQTQIFEELVPSVLPLLKEHIRLEHSGIVDHSV